LAAFVALQWALQGQPPASLLLVAASLDNTVSCSVGWERNIHAPWLTQATMRFYQTHYLPENRYRSKENWKASPIYAPRDVLSKCRNFPIWIAAMGVDILYQESLEFGQRLKRQGCAVTMREFPTIHTWHSLCRAFWGRSLFLR